MLTSRFNADWWAWANFSGWNDTGLMFWNLTWSGQIMGGIYIVQTVIWMERDCPLRKSAHAYWRCKASFLRQSLVALAMMIKKGEDMFKLAIQNRMIRNILSFSCSAHIYNNNEQPFGLGLRSHFKGYPPFEDTWPVFSHLTDKKLLLFLALIGFIFQLKVHYFSSQFSTTHYKQTWVPK